MNSREIRRTAVAALQTESPLLRRLRMLIPPNPRWEALLAGVPPDPVLVFEHGPALELADGALRLRRAARDGEAEVMAEVVRDPSPETSASLLLRRHFQKISATPATRALFVTACLESGCPEPWVTREILPALDLEPHPELLRRCARISGFSDSVLGFCSEKNLSFKQCHQLSRLDPILLEIVIEWKSRIALTAALAEELTTLLDDWLRGPGIQFHTDGYRPERDTPVVSLLESTTLSLQERTAKLRKLLKERRFPVLTATHARLEALRHELPLPAGAQLQWDPSLEKNELRLTLAIRSGAEWEQAVSALHDARLAPAIDRMIEEL